MKNRLLMFVLTLTVSLFMTTTAIAQIKIPFDVSTPTWSKVARCLDLCVYETPLDTTPTLIGIFPYIYPIMAEENGWFKLRIGFDGNEGWMPVKDCEVLDVKRVKAYDEDKDILIFLNGGSYAVWLYSDKYDYYDGDVFGLQYGKMVNNILVFAYGLNIAKENLILTDNKTQLVKKDDGNYMFYVAKRYCNEDGIPLWKKLPQFVRDSFAKETKRMPNEIAMFETIEGERVTAELAGNK